MADKNSSGEMARPVFVGQYRRVVDAQGRIRFPADWRPMLGKGRELFVLPNPVGPKSLAVVTAEDYRKEANPPAATLVKVAADGRVRIPKALLACAGIKTQAWFVGMLRTIRLSADQPLPFPRKGLDHVSMGYIVRPRLGT